MKHSKYFKCMRMRTRVLGKFNSVLSQVSRSDENTLAKGNVRPPSGKTNMLSNKLQAAFPFTAAATAFYAAKIPIEPISPL